MCSLNEFSFHVFNLLSLIKITTSGSKRNSSVSYTTCVPLNHSFFRFIFSQMGAGASFNKEEKKTREEDDEFDYPRRFNSNRIPSTRSAKTLSSVTTTRSVRAMALLNHSRHENTYITTDEISVHLRQKRQEHSHNIRDLDSKIEEGVNESEKKSEKTTKKQEEEIEENELLQTHVSVKSLRTFRNNFNLKLNLENDPDWGQVILFFILFCTTLSLF